MGIFDQSPLGATQHQIMKLAYDGSGNVEYLGLAAPGTQAATASWLVIKFTYSGSNVTDKQFANGSLDYNQTWDGRAGYSYS